MPMISNHNSSPQGDTPRNSLINGSRLLGPSVCILRIVPPGKTVMGCKRSMRFSCLHVSPFHVTSNVRPLRFANTSAGWQIREQAVVRSLCLVLQLTVCFCLRLEHLCLDDWHCIGHVRSEFLHRRFPHRRSVEVSKGLEFVCCEMFDQ